MRSSWPPVCIYSSKVGMLKAKMRTAEWGSGFKWFSENEEIFERSWDALNYKILIHFQRTLTITQLIFDKNTCENEKECRLGKGRVCETEFENFEKLWIAIGSDWGRERGALFQSMVLGLPTLQNRVLGALGAPGSHDPFLWNDVSKSKVKEQLTNIQKNELCLNKILSKTSTFTFIWQTIYQGKG